MRTHKGKKEEAYGATGGYETSEAEAAGEFEEAVPYALKMQAYSLPEVPGLSLLRP